MQVLVNYIYPIDALIGFRLLACAITIFLLLFFFPKELECSLQFYSFICTKILSLSTLLINKIEFNIIDFKLNSRYWNAKLNIKISFIYKIDYHYISPYLLQLLSNPKKIGIFLKWRRLTGTFFFLSKNRS